jgi:hypothetical protein
MIKIYKVVIKRRITYSYPRKYTSLTCYQVFKDGKCVYDGMYDSYLTRKEILTLVNKKYDVNYNSKDIINGGTMYCD